MVELTLKFENLREKIDPNERQSLYRNAKSAHKFILLTQEDVDENNWYTTYHDVGLTFGEKLNLVKSYILNLCKEYPDDPEFIEKMKKILDGLFEEIVQVRALR